MDSEEHFVEKLKEETGITIEEYNLLFKEDKKIKDDWVTTYKEEE